MKPSMFLEALYQNTTGYAEIRMLHRLGDWKLAQKLYRPSNAIHTCNFDTLAELNADYHIYHRVNVSATPNSKKENISQVVSLYVDIDDASQEALDRLNEMFFPPNAVVFSGGGYHGYWMLNEPLTIKDADSRYEVERTMQGMILAYGDGADEKAKDVTRILRTPGYYNIKDKYETHPLCEVVVFDANEIRYSFKELHRQYAPLGTPPKPVIKREIPQVAYTDELPQWVQEYLKTGANNGERNHRLYSAARCYLDAGKTQFTAEQDLMSRAMMDGLSQSEAKNTINSAFNNSRNPNMNSTMSARYAIGDAMGGAK